MAKDVCGKSTCAESEIEPATFESGGRKFYQCPACKGMTAVESAE